MGNNTYILRESGVGRGEGSSSIIVSLPFFEVPVVLIWGRLMAGHWGCLNEKLPFVELP